jgi:hypothetical protein|tara:strand:- start:9613 stop:9993 length:381 start_codon:yes stop_codon:yes gene_type:complete
MENSMSLIGKMVLRDAQQWVIIGQHWGRCKLFNLDTNTPKMTSTTLTNEELVFLPMRSKGFHCDGNNAVIFLPDGRVVFNARYRNRAPKSLVMAKKFSWQIHECWKSITKGNGRGYCDGLGLLTRL